MQTTPLSSPETTLAAMPAAELVARCSSRDCTETWREFLDRYGLALAATVRRGLARAGRPSNGDVEQDLLQEIYCRLLADGRRRLRNCRGADDRTVTGYLCRIAENVVVDHLRSANAAKRGRQLQTPSETRGGLSLLEVAADPRAGADRDVLVRESLRMLVERAERVLRGPNRWRDLRVTYLAVFEGWSSRDIACRIGSITANNVDSVVHRTKRRLAGAGLELERIPARRR